MIGFKAKRLWVSSANFTSASRQSLEFGYWTEDRALVEGAEQFLTTSLRYSEALDPESDVFEPELDQFACRSDKSEATPLERDPSIGIRVQLGLVEERDRANADKGRDDRERDREIEGKFSHLRPRN